MTGIEGDPADRALWGRVSASLLSPAPGAVSDADLAGWLDGRLSEREAARVEAALAADPALLQAALDLAALRDAPLPAAPERLLVRARAVVAPVSGAVTTHRTGWLFAWRQGLSPGRYDLGVGRYLFYRQNNLNGLIETGNPDHAGLLATGFGRIEDVQGVAARRIAERARVLAPLDVPEPLELRLGVRALEGPVLARVSVNGREIGRVDVLPDNWQQPRLLAPAALWRRELNDVVIEADGGPLALREVRFVRSERP